MVFAPATTFSGQAGLPEPHFNKIEQDWRQGDWEAVVAGDVTYRGSVDSYFASNKFDIPLNSYTLVGLRLGLIKGPWSVTAFARNLTDERAQVSAINTTQDPHAFLTVQPRTIGLTATRKF